MEYRTLGRSGLKVSAITMGTFTFGGVGPFGMVGKQDVAEAQAAGGSVHRPRRERVRHGQHVFRAGCRRRSSARCWTGGASDVLITSKARMQIGTGPNDEGVSRFHLIRECERSLKRLRTDYIDIYYMHEWDGTTPVEETMAALDTLVQQGKVRYIGCSNYSGWHIMKSLAVADRDRPPALRHAADPLHAGGARGGIRASADLGRSGAGGSGLEPAGRRAC